MTLPKYPLLRIDMHLSSYHSSHFGNVLHPFHYINALFTIRLYMGHTLPSVKSLTSGRCRYYRQRISLEARPANMFTKFERKWKYRKRLLNGTRSMIAIIIRYGIAYQVVGQMAWLNMVYCIRWLGIRLTIHLTNSIRRHSAVEINLVGCVFWDVQC